MTDFIETYDNALGKEYCEYLIDKFEASTKQPGSTSGGLRPESKISEDLTLNYDNEWQQELGQIINITLGHLVDYMKKYRYLLVGAMHTQMQDPDSGEVSTLDEAMLDKLDDNTFMALIGNSYRPGTINMQKYKKGQGHYSSWHSEIVPVANDPEKNTLHRVLTFMYYLNDVEEGGETEIFYYDRKLKPKQGQLVIKPAGFTHTHRGNVPVSNDKYILTSWILFRSAEEIYAT